MNTNFELVPILDRFGNVKNFIGNSDNDTPVTHILETPIQSMYIGIYPVEFNQYPCMRVGLETNCDPVVCFNAFWQTIEKKGFLVVLCD